VVREMHINYDKIRVEIEMNSKAKGECITDEYLHLPYFGLSSDINKDINKNDKNNSFNILSCFCGGRPGCGCVSRNSLRK